MAAVLTYDPHIFLANSMFILIYSRTIPTRNLKYDNSCHVKQTYNVPMGEISWLYTFVSDTLRNQVFVQGIA